MFSSAYSPYNMALDQNAQRTSIPMKYAALLPGLLTLFLCSATCARPTPERKQEPQPERNGQNSFSAEVRVGAEYDSNVSVDEVDAASEQGDYAALLNAQLEYQHKFAGGTEVSLEYDFAQTLYDDFSNLNRQTHMLSADLKGKIKDTDVGVSYHYVDSLLDNNEFLTMKRVSPYASMFVSKKFFTRLAYVYTDKEIRDRSERNADTNAGEFDLYWFRTGLRSYFNMGYRYKNENARAARFDYKSNSVKLRYIQRFQLFKRLAKLELAWRFEDRDYSSPTPSIEQDRNDDRHRWEVDLEIPVLEDAAITMYYKYSDYDSNLPRADYQQNVAGTQFIYRW
jgi:hypothetical protein